MKKVALKVLVFCIVICSVLCAFAACGDIGSKTDNSNGQQEKPIDENPSDLNSDNTLTLLSFEMVQKQTENVVFKQMVSSDFKNIGVNISPMQFGTENERRIDETNTNMVEVVATVKNEIRDPFIDLVLYISYLDTKIVFNEGNGEYVCASTTKLENGIWVTKISLTLNLVFDDEYMCNIEIDEINFLHGGTDIWKTDLNNDNIKRIDFGFIGNSEIENGRIKQNDIIYETIDADKAIIVGNTITADVNLEIPSEIVIGKNYKNKNGTKYTVVEIDENAFGDCRFIQSLIVPDTVGSIKNGAFKNCGTIEANISASTEIDRNAFENTLMIDVNKTQLYIYNQNNAIGDKWLYGLKEKFETLYRDYSFKEGKTGVQIIINRYDEPFDGNNIVISNDLDYKNLISNNKLLDISDVVTGNLTALGDNSKIENKLYDEQKTFLKTDGKYYAIPHAEGYAGLTYDADLFEEYGFYYLEDGTFGHSSSGKNFAAGPDGIFGTYDDGLPATYDEFFRLCGRMVDFAVTPMIFSGLYANYYVSKLVNSLIADYNGYDDERVYYTFDGTINKFIKGFDGNSPILDSRQILEANVADLFREAGYYYGFSFLDQLYNERSGSYLSTYCRTASTSFLDAQFRFLTSSLANNSQPIAMLADGTWWQNESQYSFEEMERIYGPDYSAKSRNLKFMPLPKATINDVGIERTLFNVLDSYMAINKNTPDNVVELAKLFIQFCNTDKNLQDFTVITNMTKALKYDMTTENYDKLTPFGKSVVETKQNANVIYPCSDNSFYKENINVLNRKNMFGDLISAVQANSFNVKEYFIDFANSWKVKFNNANTNTDGKNTLHKISIQETQTVFAENAQSDFEILYGNNISQKSGKFISYHILQATGAELSLVQADSKMWDINSKYIVIGDYNLFFAAGLSMPFDDLGKTGYYIKTAGNSVFIMAYSEEGYQLGAIAFLRELIGYDYLASDCVIYNKDGNFLPQIEITEKPDYEMRTIMDTLSDEDKYAMGFSDGKFCGVTGINNALHNTFVYLPPQEFYDEHPKWYSADVGNSSWYNGQLCYTAHGDSAEYEIMLNTVLQKMIEMIENNPDLDYISFIQEDNLNYCNCLSCTKLLYGAGCYSATILKFVNDLDLRLQNYLQEQANKNNVEKRKVGIAILAYSYSFNPPFKNGFITTQLCNDDIAVFVAGIGRTAQEISDAVYGWRLVCGHVFFWHYDTSFSNYLLPFPVTLLNDYVNLNKTGAERFFSNGQYNQGTATGFNTFKNYILSKIGFDTSKNIKDIEDAWFNGYFLDAAENMKAYFDSLQYDLQTVINNANGFNTYSNYITKDNFPLVAVMRYKNYINSALSAVEKYKIEDEDLYNILVKRIKAESIFPDYVLCELYADVYSESELASMRTAFKSDCVALGVTNISVWQSVETLFSSWGI